jgi:cell division transport system ATP-binding protein
MIHFLHVTKSFEAGWKALDDLSFKVNKGEFVFLIGHSGAGKTTVLRHMYMELRPDTYRGGQVIINFNRELTFDSRHTPESQVQSLRRRMGIVFQDFKLLQDRNVYENVAFALRINGTPGKKIKEKVYEALTRTGISHKRFDMPYTLSGGEQQRVAIARAMVNDPYVLIADEPTGNLDPENALEVFEILKRINAQGTTVIMATHNPSIYDGSSFRRLILDRGHLINRELI